MILNPNTLTPALSILKLINPMKNLRKIKIKLGMPSLTWDLKIGEESIL